MHKLILVSLILSFSGGLLGQKNMRPGSKQKRSKVFGGPIDNSMYKPRGLQFSFGPTYTMTSRKNETITPDSSYGGQRFRYQQDPSGLLGLSLDIGMAHFPMKVPTLKIAGLPFRILSYWDWGLGVKLYGGKESTLVEFTDATGNQVLSSATGNGKFYNTYASAHVTAHKIFYFKNPKFFIDNGLGVNFDYRIVEGSKNYDGVHFPENQRFQKNAALQLHYDLGFGIKLKKGSYFIPSLSTPVLGFSEWNGGTPAIKWFSSDYWPITLKAKFIFLFKAKSNGCNTGSAEDQKKNKEYMQNK